MGEHFFSHDVEYVLEIHSVKHWRKHVPNNQGNKSSSSKGGSKNSDDKQSKSGSGSDKQSKGGESSKSR